MPANDRNGTNVVGGVPARWQMHLTVLVYSSEAWSTKHRVYHLCPHLCPDESLKQPSLDQSLVCITKAYRSVDRVKDYSTVRCRLIGLTAQESVSRRTKSYQQGLSIDLDNWQLYKNGT